MNFTVGTLAELIQAIIDANTLPGLDQIFFSEPGLVFDLTAGLIATAKMIRTL